MNYSTAIFLVNNDVRAVRASYELMSDGKTPNPLTIRTFKTMDRTLKVGDYVVVPTHTRHNMTVNRIEETDVEIDFDSTTQVDWLVGAVDRHPYEALVEQEKDAERIIRSAEKRRRQDELAEKLLKDNPDIQRLKEVHSAAALGLPEQAPAPPHPEAWANEEPGEPVEF